MVAINVKQKNETREALRFRVGDVDVRVECDMQEVRDDFRALYAGYGAPPDSNGDDVTVQVVPASQRRWRAPRYHVFSGLEQIGPDVRLNEILPMVEWGLNYGVIARRGEFFQIHAAAMSLGDQGVIFPADSGSGKTTLCAALLVDGWRYLSDEFALIHPRTLRVHPYPKALCVKHGAFEVLRQLGLPLVGGKHFVKGLKGQVGYVNPRNVRPDAVGEVCPVRFVVLPCHVAGAPARLLSMTREQAAYELLRNSPNRSAFGDQALRIAADLVAGAECFSLRSGAIEETRKLLRGLVEA
ncbi:MAG: hypothetical protein AABZ12_14225 [Planctomycetota bacterium]